MPDTLPHDDRGKLAHVLTIEVGQKWIEWIVDDDGIPRAYLVTRAPEHDKHEELTRD